MRMPAETWKRFPRRATQVGEQVESRFAFVRVVAAHAVERDHLPPRFEWLIIEWPAGGEAPGGHRLSPPPPPPAPRPPPLPPRQPALPKGPAAARPLPRAVLPRPPVLRCGAGRCR